MPIYPGGPGQVAVKRLSVYYYYYFIIIIIILLLLLLLLIGNWQLGVLPYCSVHEALLSIPSKFLF